MADVRSHSIDPKKLADRQALLEARIATLDALQPTSPEAKIERIAQLNDMEREVIEIVCRRHELMEAPRAEHSTAMAVRTVTSLMIANGAALGIIGAGLFESNKPVFVMAALGGPGVVFLVGLLLAGGIPPAMFMANRRQAEAWGLGIFAAMVASAICLLVGLGWVYRGADIYIRCVKGETVPGICAPAAKVDKLPDALD